MPGFLVQVGAQILCPHGGLVQFVPATPRVRAGGAFLVTLGDVATVVGCTNVPTPCTMVTWTPASGATRVKIAGQPALVPPLLGTWNCAPPIRGGCCSLAR